MGPASEVPQGGQAAVETQEWKIIPDYRWEKHDEGEKVRRMTAFPVNKALFEICLSNENIEERFRTMEGELNAFFMSALKADAPLKITEVPALLFPSLKLIAQDITRLPAAINDGYTNWGRHYLCTGPSPDTLCERILDVRWRFCTSSEAKRIWPGIQWIGPEGETIQGITVAARKAAKPTQYFEFSSQSVKEYAVRQNEELYIADIYAADPPKGDCGIGLILERGWNVGTDEQNTQELPWWGFLSRLYRKGLLDVILTPKNEIHINPSVEKIRQAVLDGTLSDARPLLRGTQPTAGSQELYETAWKQLLYRDWQRADITKYDISQLTDPNRGVWELWNPDLEENVMMAIPKPVYARDPHADITGGVVGIDFGTKSTVVVSMKDSDRIKPERIGVGRYEKEVRENDYENPTVMEFLDIEHFLEAYESQKGRPPTEWRDLTISHTATQDWMSNTQITWCSSFFGELKQWAGREDRKIKIRDQKGRELDLPPYLKLKEGDLDPIELYAYYIGLYINNMHTRQIFLEYLLSFPATYSKQVRSRLLESFRKGLTKSMPRTILEDCEVSVKEGAEEAVAYAVCALEEYGFRPRGKEEIFYAVFDFGGGTTDFDFGVWRAADKEKSEEKRYNYVITHFKDSGDLYLGGENLLEMLAFQVFEKNRVRLQKEGVVFPQPPECDLPGGEYLISDSQEAHTNLKTVMEQLRPLWERAEDYAAKYQDGVLKGVRLFGRSGEIKNTDLLIDQEALENALKSRINEGVTKFLYALDAVFVGNESFRKRAERINIFLAGNSSKSELVQEAFEERLQQWTEDIRKSYRDLGEYTQAEGECFELFYPLGTPQAIQKQRDRKAKLADETEQGRLDRPTGKTGVAVGLLRCRSGSKIKVVDEIEREDEIKFKYYLGSVDGAGYFEPVLERDTPYGKWVELYGAEVPEFEFYFTTNPQARMSGHLKIDGSIKLVRRRLKGRGISEDDMICLRAVAPDEIEYVAAKSAQAADRGDYACKPENVRLRG